MAFNPAPDDPKPCQRLEQITTVWSMLGDPAQFILRYAPAIQSYFLAIIPNRHDAEEALQDFLLRVMRTGFVTAKSEHGRFRDYLKVAVRNAARAQRRRDASRERNREPLAETAVSDAGHADADDQWMTEWRACLLSRAWEALERTESGKSAGGASHVALRVVVDHPNESSQTLAARVTALTGSSINPEAFRQRISRARRALARLLVQEIAETLEFPTPHDVEDELLVLGLMPYVRRYLPDDWRSRGTFREHPDQRFTPISAPHLQGR